MSTTAAETGSSSAAFVDIVLDNSSNGSPPSMAVAPDTRWRGGTGSVAPAAAAAIHLGDADGVDRSFGATAVRLFIGQRAPRTNGALYAAAVSAHLFLTAYGLVWLGFYMLNGSALALTLWAATLAGTDGVRRFLHRRTSRAARHPPAIVLPLATALCTVLVVAAELAEGSALSRPAPTPPTAAVRQTDTPPPPTPPPTPPPLLFARRTEVVWAIGVAAMVVAALMTMRWRHTARKPSLV
jgi:hypothetical protein